MRSNLFHPKGSKAWLSSKLNDIPRYLYRVVGPGSSGAYDGCWVRSNDAWYNRRDQGDTLDVDDRTVAEMLSRHLLEIPTRSKRIPGYGTLADNFVSWTSSLLFALQYMFHRQQKYNEALADIKLIVVDTNDIPIGAFVRDMDLISVYKQFNRGLWKVESIRQRRYREDSRIRYYFGEYISQGALYVAGKSAVVSAQALVDGGLFRIQPAFATATEGWANKVFRLRRDFFRPAALESFSFELLQAAGDLGQLFGHKFRLPMTACFVSLRPIGDDWQVDLLFSSPGRYICDE